jgi:hypothetical protein
LNILEDHIISLKESILPAAFEEGGVLLNVQDRVCMLVNRTGMGILELLDGKRDVKQVSGKLAVIYGKPEDEVKDDIITFLSKLLEKGWLNVV